MTHVVQDSDTAWIEQRSRCTLLWILDDLYRLADANIFRINRLGYSELEKYPFKLQGSVSQGRFDVEGWFIGSKIDKSPPGRVSFCIDGDSITISPNIVVTRQWDVFEEKCHLRVTVGGEEDSRRYTAAKVVQAALEPLFFRGSV